MESNQIPEQKRWAEREEGLWLQLSRAYKAFYKVYTFRRECVDVYGILGFHVEMDDVL